RRPWISSAFQNDDLAGSQRAGYSLRCGDDGAEIGFLGAADRSRNADQHEIALPQPARVASRPEPFLLNEVDEIIVLYVRHVRRSGVKQLHTFVIDVELKHSPARACGRYSRRQSNVSETDDPCQSRLCGNDTFSTHE